MPAASAAPTCTTSSTAASAPCASRSPWCWGTKWPARSGRRARTAAASPPASASPSAPAGPAACAATASRACRTTAWTCATTAARCARRTCRARSASRSSARPGQAHRLADHVSDEEGALAEPLAVALHAVRRAGPMLGQRVLVTGCGPIGALLVIAARRAGAAHIVVTDIGEFPLRKAPRDRRRPGAQRGRGPRCPATLQRGQGHFDVLLEASGNEKALRAAFDAVRPRGVIVQVGLGGEMTLPINAIVAKEFDLRGAFRFHEEFAVAVAFLNQRLIDGRPVITDIVARPGHACLYTRRRQTPIHEGANRLWRRRVMMQHAHLPESLVTVFSKVILYDTDGRAKFREEAVHRRRPCCQSCLCLAATSCATALWAFAASFIARRIRSGSSSSAARWKLACRAASPAFSSRASISIPRTCCRPALPLTRPCTATGAARSGPDPLVTLFVRG
jgi:hypothetical protein